MRIPLRIRHVHHDWLTRAAPGAPCRFARKTPFALHTSFRRKNAIRGAQTHVRRAAGVSPPWVECCRSKRGSFRTAGSRQPLLCTTLARRENSDIGGAQTNIHESGGRQPAVVAEMRDYREKMQLLAATEHHQERRALARRGSVTYLQRRQRDTAGLRQPLLVVKTAAAREMRIPLRIRHVHHDWLTRAAPGAPCRFARKTPFALHTSFRRKKRHSRCTNARF